MLEEQKCTLSLSKHIPQGDPPLEDNFCRNHDRYTSNKSHMHVNWPACARIY